MQPIAIACPSGVDARRRIGSIEIVAPDRGPMNPPPRCPRQNPLLIARRYVCSIAPGAFSFEWLTSKASILRTPSKTRAWLWTVTRPFWVGRVVAGSLACISCGAGGKFTDAPVSGPAGQGRRIRPTSDGPVATGRKSDVVRFTPRLGQWHFRRIALYRRRRGKAVGELGLDVSLLMRRRPGLDRFLPFLPGRFLVA